MVTQTNLKRFRRAQVQNPAGVLYVALDSGYEIRLAMTDGEKFGRWLQREKHVAGVTVIVLVVEAPQTACYYSVEDFLSGQSRELFAE